MKRIHSWIKYLFIYFVFCERCCTYYRSISRTVWGDTLSNWGYAPQALWRSDLLVWGYRLQKQTKKKKKTGVYSLAICLQIKGLHAFQLPSSFKRDAVLCLQVIIIKNKEWHKELRCQTGIECRDFNIRKREKVSFDEGYLGYAPITYFTSTTWTDHKAPLPFLRPHQQKSLCCTTLCVHLCVCEIQRHKK